jgi:adenine-specific DNA-methyltransferase
MASVLDDYLSAVDDPELAAKIRAEIDKTSKQFGLVFERHQQEGIRMPSVPVELGSKVILDADDTFHTVVGLDGLDVTLVDRAGDERNAEVTEVTVAREFGDTMYPGLKPIDEIRQGGVDDPVHTIINGENYHALEMLQYTHAGAIDLIYVDPPYNTGNKTWKYNDRYVAEKDSYRHSKWLSFMEKRLLLAKKLLTPTGVIVVAIDDNEHHRLRMLMDQVFGAGNFLANLTWQGKPQADSRFAGGGVDYMLVYAHGRENMVAADLSWREEKPGLSEVLSAAKAAFDSAHGDIESASRTMRAWWKANGSRFAPGMKMYRHIDIDGSLYRLSDVSFPNGQGKRFDILHPVTGVPVKVPSSGWSMSEKTAEEWVESGRMVFGTDHLTLPQQKKTLGDGRDSQVPSPSFVSLRLPATQQLIKLLGDKRFPFPKDHTVLMRWLRLIAPKDAIILDFFGGSGTTAEAVMRLNAEDGGTRQAILVTNNELSAADDKALRAQGHTPGSPAYEALGVFHHVTRPRISTVITGIREDGSKYGDGLAANAAFFDLQYLDRARVKYGHEFDSLAGVFWLRAGGRGPLIHRENLAKGFAYDPESTIAVLFRPGRASQLAEAIAAAPNPNLTHVFIVTESDEQGNVAASYFRSDLTIERIYGSYLSAFQVNKKD